MNEEQYEELRRACVIIGECCTKAVKAVAAEMAIVSANLSDIVDDVMDHYDVDNRDEFLQAIERMIASADMGDLAEDLDDITPTEKLPRPPKRIGPVNKSNYSHNRPQRRARSSCLKKVR